MQQLNLTLLKYNEYALSVITFNIYVYIILIYSLFSLFFIFDLKYVKTLNELKYTNYLDSISIFFILSFLSFAGVPPLFGFASKFLLFTYLSAKANVFISYLLVIFNFFSLFFYLQNVRFMTSSNSRVYFNIKNNFVFWDTTLFNYIVLLNLLNILGFIFVEDYLAYFNLLFSYIY